MDKIFLLKAIACYLILILSINLLLDIKLGKLKNELTQKEQFCGQCGGAEFFTVNSPDQQSKSGSQNRPDCAEFQFNQPISPQFIIDETTQQKVIPISEFDEIIGMTL